MSCDKYAPLGRAVCPIMLIRNRSFRAPMKIVLFYAMRKEIASLLSDERIECAESAAGVNFYRFSENLIACSGGIGKVNAAMATQLCIDRYAPDLIINVGVAGCFVNAPIGTIMLADKFIQHDVDTTGCGDPLAYVSTVNRIHFPVSYLDRAKRALDKIAVPYLCGLGATGDWFAKRSPRSDAMRDNFNPLFVEMEGGAIAQVCLRNDTPFLALKSVSDCIYGDDHYDFNFEQAMTSLNGIVVKFIEQFTNDD